MTSRETTILRAIAKSLRPHGDQSEMIAFARLYLPPSRYVTIDTVAQLIDYVASGAVD